MRKNKRDLLNKSVSSRLTAEDKSNMKDLKKDTGKSYAELIREALRITYPKYFTIDRHK